MKIITINIPEETLRFIKLIVATGEYTSRSELIRSCVRDWVKDKLKEIRFMEDYNILKERYNALSNIYPNTRPEPKETKPVKTKKVTKSDEIITDKDGNEWHVKKVMDVPVHRKHINEEI